MTGWRKRQVGDMAREAKLPEAGISDTGVLKWSDLEAFAELVRAEEREACAKVCDDIDTEYEGEDVLATWCSRAIRARKNKHD